MNILFLSSNATKNFLKEKSIRFLTQDTHVYKKIIVQYHFVCFIFSLNSADEFPLNSYFWNKNTNICVNVTRL